MAGRALTIDITTKDQQTLAALKRIQRELGQLDKSIDQTAKQSNKLGEGADEYARKLSQAREAAGGIELGGTVAVLGLSTKAAGDLAEAQSKTNAVFKESVGVIDEFAEGATDALALSKREALEAASTFGNLFTQLGVGTGQAAEMSKSMITLGGDFAAFHNANPVDVIEAQTAAFRGEYDALQKFVPTINAAAVEQRAMADTGKDNAKELTAQEKALATYNIMLENAGEAQGAAAREADGLAMSAKRAKAELENSAATIGEALVPIAADGAKAVAFLAESFGTLPPAMQTGVVGIGGLVIGLGLLGPKISEGVGMLRSGISTVRAYGAETATTGQRMAGAAAGAGALAGALVMGVAAWNQWGAAGRAAAGGWVDKFDQSNGRTVEGMRRTAAESRAFADSIITDYDGILAGRPDVGDLFEIGAEREAAEGKKASEAKALAFELAADRVEEAARKSGLTVAEAEQAMVAQGIDPTIMSVEKLVEKFGEYKTSAAGVAAAEQNAAAASADLAAKLAEQEAAADDARSAVDALASAEEGVASAQDGVVSARDQLVDAERGVADARKGVADASRGVQDAEEGLADARADAVDAVADLAEAEREQRDGSEQLRDAQRGVEDAERSLADAQRASLTAQEDLNAARETAAERLERLKEAVGDSFEQRQAELAVAQARERIAELDGDASGTDRQSAALSLEGAERRLAEVLKERAETEELLAEEQAKGVEGSAEVVAAKEAIEDAARNEKDAALGLIEAHQSVTAAQEEMAARVVEAQGRVAEANDRVKAAADGVRDAQDQVVEAQQRVVDATEGVVEARGAVAEAEDQVTEALVAQVIAQDAVKTALGNSKGALDEQIVKLLELAGQMDPGSPVRQRMLETAEQLNSLTARPWTIQLQTQLQAVDAINKAMELALSGTDPANRPGGRAIGGRVGPGLAFPVGERGPEMLELDPSEAGRVYTADQWEAEQRRRAAFAERSSRRQESKTQAVRDVHFNVTVAESGDPWATGDAVARQVMRAMQVGPAH